MRTDTTDVLDAVSAPAPRSRRTLPEHERWALALIARDAPAEETLTELCLAVERRIPDALCAVLLVNPAGTHLSSFVSPSIPAAYGRMLGDVPIANNVGSCGTAAWQKSPVIVADVTTDARWAAFAELALSHGLRACWSLPFFGADGEVAGTFAVYSRQPRLPRRAELRFVSSTARIAEVAAQHERQRRALGAVQTERGLLFRTLGAGILTFDASGRLASANPAACDALCLPVDALVGRTVGEVFADARDADGRPVRDLAAAGPDRGGLLLAVKGACPEERWLKCTFCAIGGEDALLLDRSLVCSFIDVTRMKHAQDELARRATEDDLTGLVNRAGLRRATEALLVDSARTGRSLAMLVMDLDGFKHVNDTLGHAAGDSLLKEVAHRLGMLVRPPSVLARRSGDEFVVLMPGCDEAAATRLATDIVDALRLPFRHLGEEIFLGASIGGALHPDHGTDEDHVFRHADAAMYRAKRAGRSRFVMHRPSDDAAGTNRLALDAQFRRALVREEFVLHWQPRLDARTGRIAGLEALVRWNHPERGLLYPDAFIAFAEESGLVVPLGEWVLEAACRRMAAWHAAGHAGLRVSVNVAPAQFTRAFLEVSVPRALAASGLPGTALELEVTETTMMVSLDALTHEAMQALRARGVRILLDDFGTGYSSLSYLQRFAVDGLKVDRCFVSRLPDATDAQAITRAILGMARALKLETIAEGVENTGQSGWLMRSGCTELQGFLFARPMPETAIDALLARPSGLHWPRPPVSGDWLPAPLPADEAARQAAIARADLAEGRDHPTLDAIVQTVSRQLAVPIALVSIVEGERQWFKARVGLEATETPRDVSFCGHAVHGEGAFVVEDAHADPRFATNPLVTGAPGVRFYAGVPILVRDPAGLPRRIGTLCAIDHAPRSLDAAHRDALENLAWIVSRTLDPEG